MGDTGLGSIGGADAGTAGGDPNDINNQNWWQGLPPLISYDKNGQPIYGKPQTSGGGLPFGPGGNYAPSVPATTTANGSIWPKILGAVTGAKGSTWLDNALNAYATWQSTKKGKFQQAPESPEMTALRQKILQYIDNSPTRNMLGGMLGPMIQRNATSNFQLPQGAYGYNPNQSGAPQYDLSKILGNISGSGIPNSGTQTAGPQPNPNDPVGGGGAPTVQDIIAMMMQGRQQQP